MKELLQVEHQIAKRTGATAIDLESASIWLDLPEDVRGMRILDIGGGASTVTLELARRGTQAVAIDYKYDDFTKLRTSMNKFTDKLKKMRGRVKSAKLFREIGDTFFNSIPEGLGQYAAALAGDLPFLDETFDLCFSTRCLSVYLIEDKEAFMNGIF
ncbi:class I SAM-dependent methyltransferase [Candidatus Microgenomates bacterium]|nr:class I SAM-dependent methyltransferase [Candidatus Microgenomates bacterium]